MSTTVAHAISAIRQAIPQAHLVTTEAGEEYQSLNNSYLSGFESDLFPACIFLPRSRDEVAAFIRAIEPFVGHVQFAIRAAGRQPLPGCANIDNGITVDLRSLKGIQIQDGCVHVAAGELWGSVYEHLEPHGLGVTGGKSTTCGIGGLATQGKYDQVDNYKTMTPKLIVSFSSVIRWSVVLFIPGGLHMRQRCQLRSRRGLR